MINPKHSTAKTRKANDRPEKQSNKNKNQWHNDTKRSENMNTKPSIQIACRSRQRTLNMPAQTKRKTKQLYLKAYNGRFYDTALNEASDVRIRKYCNTGAVVEKERAVCPEGLCVKTMLYAFIAIKTLSSQQAHGAECFDRDKCVQHGFYAKALRAHRSLFFHHRPCITIFPNSHIARFV